MEGDSELVLTHNGHSVNDNLLCHFSHVSHISTDDAAMLMHFLRLSALIAKVDIQDAYMQIDANPPCRLPLLRCIRAMCMWTASSLLDRPRHQPLLYNALAEALECILRSRANLIQRNAQWP